MHTAHSATITTPSDREIVITRTFHAPRALVFETWTKSEHVTHWWDPSGVPLASCDIDLRPTGAFRFVHQGPHGYVFAGVYREIAPPERLVFATPAPSGGDTIGALRFAEQQGETTLVLTMTCPSKADRDALLQMRVDQGTARTLDNLDRYLETMR